jgi:1,2-diacylglycerol 3-beta-glucosyltransferase
LIDIVLGILQTPFLVLALFLSLYLLILTLAPLIIPKRKQPPPQGRKKFAIIVPAHNEEKVIEKTLRSALQVAYPKNLFDVIVVADNCTDQTAKIALKCGAIVFQRFDTSRRGKGFALNWIIPQVLERLPAPGYDACVFVDADSVMMPKFLEEMNVSLHAGHRVIQSSDLVLDNSNSWRVQLMLVAFALQNYVRQLGKSRLGFSILLKGNGMCFAADVLRTMKWDEASLGEDLDMGVELIRRGEKIHFNPDAVTQRIRWEGGRFASMKSRVPLVLKEALKKRSIVLFEAAIDAAFPPLAILLLGSSLFVVLNGLLLSSGWITSTLIFWGWVSVIAMMSAHCILGLILARVGIRNLLALLYVPRYLVWKLGVYLSMLAGKASKGWVRTER